MKTFRIKTKEQQRCENGGIEYPTWCHGGMDCFEGKLYTEGGPGFVSYDQYGGLTLKDGFGCLWCFHPSLYEVTDLTFATHLTGDVTLRQDNADSIAHKTADLVYDKLRTELFKQMKDDSEGQKSQHKKEIEDWKEKGWPRLNTHTQSTSDEYSSGCNTANQSITSGKGIEIKEGTSNIEVSYNPEWNELHCLKEDKPIGLNVKEKDAVTLKPLPYKKSDKTIALRIK